MYIYIYCFFWTTIIMLPKSSGPKQWSSWCLSCWPLRGVGQCSCDWPAHLSLFNSSSDVDQANVAYHAEPSALHGCIRSDEPGSALLPWQRQCQQIKYNIYIYTYVDTILNVLFYHVIWLFWEVKSLLIRSSLLFPSYTDPFPQTSDAGNLWERRNTCIEFQFFGSFLVIPAHGGVPVCEHCGGFTHKIGV